MRVKVGSKAYKFLCKNRLTVETLFFDIAHCSYVDERGDKWSCYVMVDQLFVVA